MFLEPIGTMVCTLNVNLYAIPFQTTEWLPRESPVRHMTGLFRAIPYRLMGPSPSPRFICMRGNDSSIGLRLCASS